METPQNTMSTHLGILARAGLLTSERQSRSIIYRANPEGMTSVLVHLINDVCEGRASGIDDLKAGLASRRPLRK
jgi:DNA-binding transcriptional ArsR family regulator